MPNNHPTGPDEIEPEKAAARSTRSRPFAFLVASGIFLSRLTGLVRDRVFAHFFGNSDAADAFKAAFRIPNFLQNLFGEGVLSASFIPVYARQLAQGDEEEARRTAGAVAALLALPGTGGTPPTSADCTPGKRAPRSVARGPEKTPPATAVTSSGPVL